MADDKDDDKPRGDEFAVKFKTEGEFLAAVDKKLKSRVKEATETATRELLAKLGVESPDDLEGIADKLKTSTGAATEAEALKKLNGKLAKDLEKSQQANAAHVAKIQGIARRDALMPFAGQVRDVEALSLFVSPHLEVSEDGTVTGRDGKAVDDIVKDVLKAKDYLRNPDFKDGAGTKATASKVKLPFAVPAADDKNAKPLTIGQQIMNELVSAGKLTAPGVGGGP